MSIKSVLDPKASTMAAIATAGTVFAIYQLNVGSVSQATITRANNSALENSRKKAGYTALAAVAALTLITKDANIGILGAGSIIAMELAYRHGIMADNQSMKMQNPNPETAYMPAENVVPLPYQGETA
jgi:hypothetical protein